MNKWLGSLGVAALLIGGSGAFYYNRSIRQEGSINQLTLEKVELEGRNITLTGEKEGLSQRLEITNGIVDGLRNTCGYGSENLPRFILTPPQLSWLPHPEPPIITGWERLGLLSFLQNQRIKLPANVDFYASNISVTCEDSARISIDGTPIAEHPHVPCEELLTMLVNTAKTDGFYFVSTNKQVSKVVDNLGILPEERAYVLIDDKPVAFYDKSKNEYYRLKYCGEGKYVQDTEIWNGESNTKKRYGMRSTIDDVIMGECPKPRTKEKKPLPTVESTQPAYYKKEDILGTEVNVYLEGDARIIKGDKIHTLDPTRGGYTIEKNVPDVESDSDTGTGSQPTTTKVGPPSVVCTQGFYTVEGLKQIGEVDFKTQNIEFNKEKEGFKKGCTYSIRKDDNNHSCWSIVSNNDPSCPDVDLK